MKLRNIQLLLASTFIVGAVAMTSEAKAADQTTSVYRLYNKNTGEHFYTTSRTESINAVMAGWNDEGIGWVAPTSSKSPVYRVYNPHAKGGDHYYTKSKYEAQSLVNKGWKWDGNAKPVFYSGGKSSVYVAYNPFAQTGSHNYTPNSFEQKSLLSNGWKYGATAWNAITKFNWTVNQYNSLVIGDNTGKGGTAYDSIIASHDIPTDTREISTDGLAIKTIIYDTTKWDYSGENYKSVILSFIKQDDGSYLLAHKTSIYLSK